MGQADKKKNNIAASASPTADGQHIPVHNNIVIVGAGLAGLFTALKLAPIPVTVLTAKSLGSSASSLWAQGGIAAAIGQGDTAEDHARDTIKAGKGLVEEDIAKLVTSEASARIHDLLEYGVPFDQNLKGQLELSREAAHSTNRIVRVAGDQAGAAIMAALIETVKQTPSIRVIEHVSAHKLKVENGRVTGLYLWPAASQATEVGTLITANQVILATGGIGQLYSKTTNPGSARGEGLAMAAAVGAVIADPEFVQFHPTAIDAGLDPAPLATEALRGEGAHLIDKDGNRLMQGIHPDMELAPRDIVARTVFRSVTAGKGAFLDCRMIDPAHMKDHYKTVMENCLKAGIDPTMSPIPISPAAHFHMGGIKTDEWGQSSVPGLWACGEVAATGLHGANRLASNSLLEAVVFAERIARKLKTDPENNSTTAADETNTTLLPQVTPPSAADQQAEQAAITSLREIMFTHAGLERTAKGLNTALRELDQLTPAFEGHQRSLNMALTARFVLIGALNREHSLGSHYRTDEDGENSKQAIAHHRTYLTIKDIKTPPALNQTAGLNHKLTPPHPASQEPVPGRPSQS